MNIKANTTGWELPNATAEFLAKHQGSEIQIWSALRIEVAQLAKASGFTKTEVARRSGVADSTFSQWLSGKYTGTLSSVNDDIDKWLRAASEARNAVARIPRPPAFLNLKASTEIIDTLEWAHYCPDLVMITCGAGVGKTETCRHYERTRPHVYQATVSENTKTVHGMLVELAQELGVNEHNPARLARAIGNKLRRMGDGTLLIVDEGQHLNDQALNQLRHFVDIYECGVAIVGNKEVYDRFQTDRSGPSYDQLKSRIGKRLLIDNPYTEDLVRYIHAWGNFSDDVVEYLVGIGLKGGALRQIEKTVKLAMMLLGEDDTLTVKHVATAWKNRNVESIA
ncbi:AAA family ATPase [Gellertiella hungarica]|uniref:HTH cro/C1-type domain-containing protein n=1 Tax=Gellertiella hungarica TaxID=1572859 RepID=A0A7W6NLS6_9HYPH|nr:AAA family ATPase [Gellertiella hungarica]MBB4066248.1 hypothetical protein [Gellertiella hungarica]